MTTLLWRRSCAFKRPGKAVELTRFSGHVSFCKGGVHHAEIKTPLPGGLSPEDD